MSKKTTQSRNDQRSDVKNPNNAGHKAAKDNRSVQLNTHKQQTAPAPVKKG